jgi:hypothetical protein
MEGGRIIPGASTVHFDEVSRKRIFASVDKANFSDIRLIKENYVNLKNKGSIIFLVGLAMPHYRLLIPSASLDMNLRQCFRVITPTATNSGTACFLTPRRTQAS